MVDGSTALIKAIQKGCLGAAIYLVKINASVRITDKDGLTPLHHAAIGGSAIIAEKIIAKHTDVKNLCDNYGRTALHHAAEWRNSQVLRLLLEGDAEFDKLDDHGYTPLDLFCKALIQQAKQTK